MTAKPDLIRVGYIAAWLLNEFNSSFWFKLGKRDYTDNPVHMFYLGNGFLDKVSAHTV